MFAGLRISERLRLRREKARTGSTQILAGSPRTVRYYTGINFKEFGGRILPLPETQRQFEEFVRNTNAPIIIEVDYWERTQPEWIFPMDTKRIKYLSSFNFYLEKTINRRVKSENKKVVLVSLKDSTILHYLLMIFHHLQSAQWVLL